MGKIKVGVFGAQRGMTMIHELIDNPDAELVAICDKYLPLLDDCKKLADDKGVKVALYEKFDDFFQHDMDAVVMANYAHEHAKFAIPLLKSGRNIMSEVLTCANMAEAVALIEAVEESGKFYAYGENYCFFKSTMEMKRRYQRGDIGELTHAEGEYIHDCSSIWPQITYGQRDHWRNRANANFYCTHSFGPIMYMTGLRPVKVFGIEGINAPFMRELGHPSPSHGMEIIQLSNHATVKSLHGCIKRQPESINYQLFGTKGCMETERWDYEGHLDVYTENGVNCGGTNERYLPEFVDKEAENAGHGGGDFFTMHYFINALMGDEEAKSKCINVYDAVDMCAPGILAFRSIALGGIAQDVPDLRIKANREAYRNDTFCAFKESAGDMFTPANTQENVEIPDSVYETVKDKWLKGLPG